MCDPHDLELALVTHSPAETEQIGERIGALLQAGDLVCLWGTLGAGKTCLARGLARGWGAVEAPNSPTFTLINEYHRAQGTERFYHADCYRLADSADARTTGIEDLFDAPAVLVIEWPERISDLLPAERLIIELEDRGGDDRTLRLVAHGARACELLRALRTAPA
jgi:tRNA threonylcarbamoyladenosine biosynthesis protein TsaE